VAEGAPLLREYVGKTCIKGSNPFDSASAAFEQAPKGAFLIGKTALSLSRPIPRNLLQSQNLVGVGKG
jgi:hypothetical protein